MNGPICTVNAARVEKRNAAGKIASALATRKKRERKKRDSSGRGEQKRTTYRVLCRTRSMVALRKAKKTGNGLHKNTDYEMQNKHTLVRSPCFAYAPGNRYDRLHRGPVRFDSILFVLWRSTIPLGSFAIC